jgi:hypothetical protein
MIKFVITFGLFWGVIIALFFWMCHSVRKESKIVYGKLDEFKKRANEAKDAATLEILHKEFWEYAKKKCCVKPYGYEASKIDQFMRGKYAGLVTK